MSITWYETKVMDTKGKISPVVSSHKTYNEAWDYLLFLVKHKGYFKCEVKVSLMTKIDGMVYNFGEMCSEYKEEINANTRSKK